MSIKKMIVATGLILSLLANSALAATDIVKYSYDESLQVIRADYNGAVVVDYVYDGSGNRLYRTTSITGAPANNPPGVPVLQSPGDGATGVSARAVFSWTASDPDPEDVVVCDFFLGTDPQPKLYRGGLRATTIQTKRLLPMTTYYWTVAARDSRNAKTRGPIWSFTTGNEPPGSPEYVFPTQSDKVAYGNVYLAWNCHDPDIGDKLTYRIYFGTGSNPALVETNYKGIRYDLGQLEPATTYYWKIEAIDSFGAVTSGPVISFTTLDHEPVVMNSRLTSDTTLKAEDGPYLLASGFSVPSGVTLTIEAGTVIKVAQGRYFDIGGKLVCQGTADLPVIITSERDDRHGGDTNGDGDNTRPLPGDWQGIRLSRDASDNLFKFTHILYGGGTVSAAIRIQNSSTAIEDCLIASSGNYGITTNVNSVSVTRCVFNNNYNYDIYTINQFTGSITDNRFNSGVYITTDQNFTLEGNTFNYDDKHPVRLHADKIGNLTEENTFENISQSSFLEVSGGVISHDAAWPAVMPYHVLGSITIQGTDGDDGVTTLTIAAGAELRFGRGCFLQVGNYSGDPGALVARGTKSFEIVFTSNGKPRAAGDWYGIRFYKTADGAICVLEHCVIEYAGRNSSGCLVEINRSAPAVRNCVLRHSQGYGISLSSSSSRITGNIFVDIANYDLSVSGCPDLVITGNTINSGIKVQNGVTGDLSGNIFNYDNSHPIRVGADDVGKLASENTFTNVTAESYVEVNGGTIVHDATWPAVMPYHVLGSIYVQGTDGGDGVTTLTIGAGAQLRFSQGCYLQVGNSSGDPGALVARGTESAQIVFTSNQDPQAAGDWNGIRFYKTADDATCVLEHCVIEYAGRNSSGYLVQINSSSPAVKDCTLRHSQGYGISLSSSSSRITGNVFVEIANYDLYVSSCPDLVITGNTINSGIKVQNGVTGDLSGNIFNYDDSHPIRVGADDVGKLFGDNTFNDLTAESYIEINGGTVTHDATWPAVMPYHVLGSIYVQGTDGDDGVTTLTIGAGARLRFGQGCYLQVGNYSGDPGALVARGTESAQIVFTSNQDPQAAGDWRGIRFYKTANDAICVLEHCVIEYAGQYTNGSLVLIYNSSPRIEHCILRHSQGYGISLSSSSSRITGNIFVDIANYDLSASGCPDLVITGNTINSGIKVQNGVTGDLSGNIFNYDNSHPIRVGADDVGKLFGDNTFNDLTAESYIEISGGTVTHDATWPAVMPYHVLGSIYVQGTDGDDAVTTLTIAAGARLRFGRYCYLQVGSYSGDPGALVARGTESAQIVFTSSQDPRAAGDWNGIRFYKTADDATCVLEYCIIEYGGQYTNGRLVEIVNSSPRIEHCILRHSQGYGIYARYSSATISGCTISYCGGRGIYWQSGGGTISGNSFAANGDYDIYLSGMDEGRVTGNTLTSGLYVSSGSVGTLSGNTIACDDAHPIRVEADDVGKLVSGNTFSNVTSASYIEVNNGTIVHDATWPAVMPYHIVGNIYIRGTDGDDGVTTLTIAAGAQLHFGRYCYLQVGSYSGDPGALVARGTESEQIVFTSNQDPRAAGDWRGIEFGNTADDATCVLEHCVIEYAGQYTYGCLVKINRSSPAVRNCILRHSQGRGVYVDSDAAQIVNCTFSDTEVGIYVYRGTPFIQGNKIEGNRQFGIQRLGAPEIIAEENWWGHASGPYNEATNPGGQGDKASDNVDFDPWVIDPNDMDIDGLPDAWEKSHFGDLTTVDQTTDYDGDGLADTDEYTYDTDPKDIDTDDDGKSDGQEVAAGTDPNDPSSN